MSMKAGRLRQQIWRLSRCLSPCRAFLLVCRLLSNWKVHSPLGRWLSVWFGQAALPYFWLVPNREAIQGFLKRSVQWRVQTLDYHLWENQRDVNRSHAVAFRIPPNDWTKMETYRWVSVEPGESLYLHFAWLCCKHANWIDPFWGYESVAEAVIIFWHPAWLRRYPVTVQGVPYPTIQAKTHYLLLPL